MPLIHPCLLVVHDAECLSSVLSDPSNISFTPSSTLPLTSVEGGFALPPGELEEILELVRDQQATIFKLETP